MTLGPDKTGSERELLRVRGKRKVRVVLSWIFGLIFLLFAAGTTWALTTDNYAWEENELTVEIVTIAVSLLLAVFFGLRAHRIGRLLAESESFTALWLPPSGRPKGKAARRDGVDLGDQTPRLRSRSIRAAAIGVVWGAPLLAGIFWFNAQNASAERLLHTGNAVPGQVLSVGERKGVVWMEVRFRIAGTTDTRAVVITRGSDRQYAVGGWVTVVYDPANPTNIRTTDEKNISEGQRIPVVGTIIVSVTGILWGAATGVGWWRRYRSVRATGWRTAAVAQELDSKSRSLPIIRVQYRDGGKIRLRVTPSSMFSTTPLGNGNPLRGWVGGVDQSMVVLITHGRRHPRAVGAKALAPQR
jgi:hypothetical protein